MVHLYKFKDGQELVIQCMGSVLSPQRPS